MASCDLVGLLLGGGGGGGRGETGREGGSEGLRDCVYVGEGVCAGVDAGEGRDRVKYIIHY